MPHDEVNTRYSHEPWRDVMSSGPCSSRRCMGHDFENVNLKLSYGSPNCTFYSELKKRSSHRKDWLNVSRHQRTASEAAYRRDMDGNSASYMKAGLEMSSWIRKRVCFYSGCDKVFNGFKLGMAGPGTHDLRKLCLTAV